MEKMKLGPTGQYPDGVLHDCDEGELQIALGVKDGRIVVEFGKEIKWLGLLPGGARKLARALRERADQISGLQTELDYVRVHKDQIFTLIDDFNRWISQSHRRAMRSASVESMAIHAGREHILRQVVKHIEESFIGELSGDPPADEDPNRYVDEIDFDAIRKEKEPSE